jgi:hypothetical protein
MTSFRPLKKSPPERGAVLGLWISKLARTGLNTPAKGAGGKLKNGVPVFPARRGEIVTLEHVKKIMDEEGI